MTSKNLAKNYDQIASQWNSDMQHSTYGVSMLVKAIQYCASTKTALDVGCGSGGRLLNKLVEARFDITAIDISENMLEIAKENHTNINFENANIIDWQTEKSFDLIIAWDSIFHLPIKNQKPVIEKLCNLLNPNGILLYTFGDTIGEHIDIWHNLKFYYSSIGITENLKIIANANCECKHLELDQFPEKHVSIIVQKMI